MNKLLILAALVFTANAHANDTRMSVETLNQKLKAAHAGWSAKDNWLNHLSQAELVRMMGARDVHPTGMMFSTANSSSNEVFDWRNQNGVNYVTPILNQGNCGSCVAFATVATLETQMNISAGIPNLNPHYSAEALFACGGGGCNMGWFPSIAAQYLQTDGAVDEACAPYTMGATGKDVECSSACADSKARAQKINSFSTPAGMEAVKAALKKGPMMTTLSVYADFVTYSSGVYKHTTGDVLGGHAVSLVGFDDTKHAWIIRNSWGTDWGMNGFAYMDYDDVSGIAEDNQLLALDQQSDYLASNIRDRSFVSGVTDLIATAAPKNSEKASITLNVNGVTGESKSKTICQDSTCALHLDTTSLENGKYELLATKGSTALHRYFFVSNKSQKFDITMQPSGFNPAQPVHDRIVFGINVKTDGAVPLKRIALVLQDSNGNLKERWTDNIANDMTIGWRTPAVANGQYTVWIRGETFAGGVTANVDSAKLTLNVQN